MQNSPFVVRVKRDDLGRAMNEIRSWLDTHKIQPTEFRTDNNKQGVIFDIRFAREHEARLFEQRFA